MKNIGWITGAILFGIIILFAVIYKIAIEKNIALARDKCYEYCSVGIPDNQTIHEELLRRNCIQTCLLRKGIVD